MVIETALPFSLCKSKTHFFRQWSCYVTFIKYVVNLTVSFHRTFCFFSAVAFWSLVMWFWDDLFIMSLDDIWHIVHATVADFNCIAAENFLKFVASWEMFCYQLKKCLCNVYWNEFAKGWVKSYLYTYVCMSEYINFIIGQCLVKIKVTLSYFLSISFKSQKHSVSIGLSCSGFYTV